MKCVVCGSETGADWKKLCLSCWKKQKREQEDHNYLEAEKAGLDVQDDIHRALMRRTHYEPRRSA